jgi:hypothetical protein
MIAIFNEIDARRTADVPFCVSHGGVEWKEDMKMVFSCFSRGMLFDV